MIKTLMALAVTLSSCFAQAGEVTAEGTQIKGIKEPVTIQYLESNWGYTFKMTGYYMGTGRVDLVPVSREAAKVLQSLNKKSKYNCVIENSTYVPQVKDFETVGATYFILDINCN